MQLQHDDTASFLAPSFTIQFSSIWDLLPMNPIPSCDRHDFRFAKLLHPLDVISKTVQRYKWEVSPRSLHGQFPGRVCFEGLNRWLVRGLGSSHNAASLPRCSSCTALLPDPCLSELGAAEGPCPTEAKPSNKKIRSAFLATTKALLIISLSLEPGHRTPGSDNSQLTPSSSKQAYCIKLRVSSYELRSSSAIR